MGRCESRLARAASCFSAGQDLPRSTGSTSSTLCRADCASPLQHHPHCCRVMGVRPLQVNTWQSQRAGTTGWQLSPHMHLSSQMLCAGAPLGGHAGRKQSMSGCSLCRTLIPTLCRHALQVASRSHCCNRQTCAAGRWLQQQAHQGRGCRQLAAAPEPGARDGASCRATPNTTKVIGGKGRECPCAGQHCHCHCLLAQSC